MEIIIAALAATFWIWVPVALMLPFIIWALFEGVWKFYVNGLVYCSIERAYVSPEQAEINYESHYGGE